MAIFVVLLFMGLCGWAAFAVVLLQRLSYDGRVLITKNQDGKQIISLELEKDPDDIQYMHHISFKVEVSQDVESAT